VAVEDEMCARCASKPLAGELDRRIACIPRTNDVSGKVTMYNAKPYGSQTYDVPNAKMDENKIDECVIRERQKRQFPARNRVTLHCPAYERVQRRRHCELYDYGQT